MSQKQCTVTLVRQTLRTPRLSMDEVLFGSAMLDTDDVVRMRVAAECWNDGCRYGKLGKIFFQRLHSDPFVKALVSRC